jgi:hypothetical protein
MEKSICIHPAGLTLCIEKQCRDQSSFDRKEKANLISPVKAPPFPTQEFWADISILSVIEFFT